MTSPSVLQAPAFFGGFQKQSQEHKYNQTVFELILTLAARVNASLKLSNHTFFFYRF